MTEKPLSPGVSFGVPTGASPEKASFEYRLQRLPVGVVILDSGGYIRSVNPVARRLLNPDPDVAWSGVHILDLHPEQARAKVRWLMECARESADGEAAIVVTLPMGSLVARATRLVGDDGVCLLFHTLGDGVSMGDLAPDDARLLKLPVVRGKGGVTTLIDVDEVVSLSAQGHYADVQTLQFRAFCPRSLADLERRLDSRTFLRVHRRHLVNLRHVLAAERLNGRLCLRLADEAGTVIPVGRNKVGLVRRLLAV